MTKKFNLFQYIISQIGNNVKNGNENDTIEVSKYNNPTTVINVMVREGCFKVDSIEQKANIYEIRYLMRWDKSIDRLKLNDMLRFEDMRAYTTDALTEYDGAYCSDNVEHLSYLDDCTFELFAQMKGYTPNELQSYIEAGFLNKEILQMEYIEFLEQCLAKPYEFGEELEEEYA